MNLFPDLGVGQGVVEDVILQVGGGKTRLSVVERSGVDVAGRIHVLDRVIDIRSEIGPEFQVWNDGIFKIYISQEAAHFVNGIDLAGNRHRVVEPGIGIGIGKGVLSGGIVDRKRRVEDQGGVHHAGEETAGGVGGNGIGLGLGVTDVGSAAQSFADPAVEVGAEGVPFEVGSVNNALLVVVAQAQGVGGLVVGAREAHLVVLDRRVTVYL